MKGTHKGSVDVRFVLAVTALAAILIAGCAKKKPAPIAQTPPPPPAPTASLSANPDAIEQGQSTTLTWRTDDATAVTIDGLGTVEANGSRQVAPVQSTTYRLTAKGPGGTQEATARVTVAQPQAQSTISLSDEQMFAQNVKDVFFDYDSYEIRADQQGALPQSAAFLKQHPNWKITVEGHCDERGSIEYNLTLGTNRAEAVRNALVQAGANGGNIRPVTFGKEKPFCNESSEACWQQNRRGHFVLNK
ncbi:MAG: OmpA family protein [Acidobacteriota bacterium]|nr:OmpA family protein [Acidobacteriota bacterium]